MKLLIFKNRRLGKDFAGNGLCASIIQPITSRLIGM